MRKQGLCRTGVPEKRFKIGKYITGIIMTKLLG